MASLAQSGNTIECSVAEKAYDPLVYVCGGYHSLLYAAMFRWGSLTAEVKVTYLRSIGLQDGWGLGSKESAIGESEIIAQSLDPVDLSVGALSTPLLVSFSGSSSEHPWHSSQLRSLSACNKRKCGARKVITRMFLAYKRFQNATHYEWASPDESQNLVARGAPGSA